MSVYTHESTVEICLASETPHPDRYSVFHSGTTSTELRFEDIEDAGGFQSPTRNQMNREQRRKLKKQ